MTIEVLKSKVHRAVITEANLNYIGSLTLDADLMDAANMIEYEKIHVVNVNNGERLETYLIKGERGSGVVCLNGAVVYHDASVHHVVFRLTLTRVGVFPGNQKDN